MAGIILSTRMTSSDQCFRHHFLRLWKQQQQQRIVMIIRVLLPVLFLFICHLPSFSSGSKHYNPVKCRRSSYYSKDKVTAMKLGYCWKLRNYNFTYNEAVDSCKRMRARLLAVNSKVKAVKLSKYIAASVKLYASGEMGSKFQRIYEKGWPGGDEFWLSEIVDGKWKTTGVPVQSAAAQPGTAKQGRQCVLFNFRKSTWQYTGCERRDGKHPTICEESEHVYAEDVGAEHVTVPPFTLPPTPSPQQGARFTCPGGFDIFEKQCFLLTNVRLSMTGAEKKCNAKGGRQAYISTASKDATVRRYLKGNEQKIGFLKSVWLSRIEGNGYIIKWKSSGTNARYLFNARSLRIKDLLKGVEEKLYMKPSGSVSYCRETCLNYKALCEADGIWKSGNKIDELKTTPKPPKIVPPKPKVPQPKPDKPDDDEDYYYDDEYYDDEDDNPPEDEKFDPNSILTRGPK